jgi:orotate phosphoribosyltransferase
VVTSETSSLLSVHRGDPATVAGLLSLDSALLDGHFELLSGLHSDRFVAFSRIARQDGALQLVAGWLQPSLAPTSPTAVVAPSTAGVGLGWTLARLLGVPLHLAGLDDHGRPCCLLGEPDVSGGRLLLVNDVVTTGQGLQALAETVRGRGAEVAGAAWFATRSSQDIAAILDAPVFSICELALAAWPQSECPRCTSGEPLQLAVDLN